MTYSKGIPDHEGKGEIGSRLLKKEILLAGGSSGESIGEKRKGGPRGNRPLGFRILLGDVPRLVKVPHQVAPGSLLISL